MTRSDKGKPHRKLSPVTDKSLDREFGNLCKRADWIRKVHKLQNVIKANGMYSHREMDIDFENMETLEVPEFEKKVLQRAWQFRIDQTKTLCQELADFMDNCEAFKHE